jgi:hypothetical protein
VRKLIASGHTERHLFLLGEQRVPRSKFLPIGANTDVPKGAPYVSDVSRVW